MESDQPMKTEGSFKELEINVKQATDRLEEQNHQNPNTIKHQELDTIESELNGTR